MCTAAAARRTKQRAKRPRLTFMLHAPGTWESLGKFVSSDPRYAALKVASRGHTKILLRQTNTRLIYEYAGAVVDLDQPKTITRGDPPREIVYTKKPTVRFVSKYLFSGDPSKLDDDSKDDNAAAADAEPASEPKAKKPRAAKK